MFRDSFCYAVAVSKSPGITEFVQFWKFLIGSILAPNLIFGSMRLSSGTLFKRGGGGGGGAEEGGEFSDKPTRPSECADEWVHCDHERRVGPM